MDTDTKDMTVRTKLPIAGIVLELVNEEHIAENSTFWDSLSISIYQNTDTQVVPSIRINTITLSEIEYIANAFRILYEKMHRRTRFRVNIKNLNEEFDKLK